MRKKSKRGSHVGVVLSFIVFVTFLIFLYTVLEPAIKNQTDKSQELERVGNNLLLRIEGEIKVVTIINKTSAIGDCLEVDKDNLIVSGDNILAKDASNNLLASNISDTIKVEWNPETSLIWVYLSKELPPQNEDTLTDCEEGMITLVQEKEYVFYEKLNETLFDYNESYDELKERLGVSPQSDFSFSFAYNNGTEIKTPEKTYSGNVFVKEIPIQYMDERANVQQGFIYVRLW